MAAEHSNDWHDFYLLVGTAGATLLALLFVAVSLGTGFLTDERAAATRAFYSPVVVHFTRGVFHLAAVALVPAHQADFLRRAGRRCRRDRASAFRLFVTVATAAPRLDATTCRTISAYGLLPASPMWRCWPPRL